MERTTCACIWLDSVAYGGRDLERWWACPSGDERANVPADLRCTRLLRLARNAPAAAPRCPTPTPVDDLC